MQKISGILPGSSRVTSVDLKSSRPVRPGVPSFGAPHGESNLRDQVTRSQLTMQDPNSIDVPRWRSKEDANAEIARSITDQFFRRRVEQPAPEINDSVTVADESAVRPGSLDMMDVVVDDLADDNRSQFMGFSREIDHMRGDTRGRDLVDSGQESLNVAAKKGVAYFNKPEEEEASDGIVLDTVA